VSVELRGARALLTGATGGLGVAIAAALADRGVELTLTGRRFELLESLAHELSARAIACDLSNRDELALLLSECGEVDVLIANAALPASGELTDYTPDQIDKLLDVNLRAPIALARALLPGMLGRRRGQLVFMGSLSAKATAPKSSLYSATKFALRGFALGLREDLRGSGVGVSLVLPGFISGAGMFADAGVNLPPGVGTRSPEQVATAVIDAIEQDRLEVTVAPPLLRLGAAVSMLAPGTAAALQRLAGGDRIAARFAAGQVDKRP
jgi:short-subunit dehydrogenase